MLINSLIWTRYDRMPWRGSHCIPRILTTESSRFNKETVASTAFSGTLSNISLRLLLHFLKVKPPLAKRSIHSPCKRKASSNVSDPVKRSSTYILFKSASEESGKSLPSSETSWCITRIARKGEHDNPKGSRLNCFSCTASCSWTGKTGVDKSDLQERPKFPIHLTDVSCKYKLGNSEL